jgi:hypothetical protein
MAGCDISARTAGAAAFASMAELSISARNAKVEAFVSMVG